MRKSVKIFYILLFVLFLLHPAFSLSFEKINFKSNDYINYINYIRGKLITGFTFFRQSLLARDFYPGQNLDFVSKSYQLKSILEDLESSIQRVFFNDRGELDKNWLEYLLNQHLIEGAIINKKNEIYFLGKVNLRIDNFNLKSGFYIINNSLYYIVSNKKEQLLGSFLINKSYINNRLYSDLTNENARNNLLMTCIIVENLKNQDKNQYLILYSSKNNQNSRIRYISEIKKYKRYINLIGKLNNKNQWYKYDSKLTFVFAKLSRISFVKSVYSNSQSNLILINDYKNKITSTFMYSIELLVSLFLFILFLVIVILNIHISRMGGVEKVTGNEGMKDEEEALSKKEVKKVESKQINEFEKENTINEIDSEVFKIDMEEDKAGKGLLSESENIVKQSGTEPKGSENEKFENLKKDGIIIK